MSSHSEVIAIFDRGTVRHNRNRAAANFDSYDFLLNWVSLQLIDRLQDIKRAFPFALQIGGRGFRQHQLTGISGIEKLVTLDIAENFLSSHPAVQEAAMQGDEEFLPFAPHSFDLIVSPLSLHTTNDLPGTLIQMNRALKPDGLCIAALLGGETLYELRHAMMEAEINIRGGAGPHIAPFADKQQIGSLMQRARFALPVVDSEIITVTYDSVTKLMHDLRYMGEGNCLKERRVSLGRKLVTETERIYRERFAEADGRLRATFEIIFLIGWAPHESQPQPLRPGSAEKRLADELETKETKI